MRAWAAAHMHALVVAETWIDRLGYARSSVITHGWAKPLVLFVRVRYCTSEQGSTCRGCKRLRVRYKQLGQRGRPHRRHHRPYS